MIEVIDSRLMADLSLLKYCLNYISSFDLFNQQLYSHKTVTRVLSEDLEKASTLKMNGSLFCLKAD